MQSSGLDKLTSCSATNSSLACEVFDYYLSICQISIVFKWNGTATQNGLVPKPIVAARDAIRSLGNGWP